MPPKKAESSSLQVAQILADLQTLQDADHTAVNDLLSANESDARAAVRRRSSTPGCDNKGRRTARPNGGPAPLRRLNSTASSGYGRSDSGFETPTMISVDEELDEDMRRAKTLLELFEMRGLFKELGDTGLMKAKSKVDQAMNGYKTVASQERRT